MSVVSRLSGQSDTHKVERSVSGTKDTLKVTTPIANALNSVRPEIDEGTPYNPSHYHVKVPKNLKEGSQ